MLLLSDKPISCCAAGTNGCLDFRHFVFALDGQMRAEWSRCPGSMARRAREAPMQRSSAGWMPARIGSLSTDVGRRHPVTIHKASLMVGSMRRVWALRHQTGAQYTAVEYISARVAVRSVAHFWGIDDLSETLFTPLLSMASLFSTRSLFLSLLSYAFWSGSHDFREIF